MHRSTHTRYKAYAACPLNGKGDILKQMFYKIIYCGPMIEAPASVLHYKGFNGSL